MHEKMRVLTFSAVILLLYYIIYSLPTRTINVKYSNDLEIKWFEFYIYRYIILHNDFVIIIKCYII